MNDFLAPMIFSQAAADPASITGLFTQLGVAGVVIAMAYYFLNYLKEEGDKQRKFQEESQRKFQDQLDKLADRHEASQREFQRQVQTITENQNGVLREITLAIKSLETTVVTIERRVDIREAREDAKRLQQ